MMEILRTGSAPGVSMPSRACPDSWKAVRSRSPGDSTIPRAAPRTIFSREPLKSGSGCKLGPMPVWACTRPEATASASAAWSRSVGGIQIRVDLSTAAIFALIAFGLAAWQFPAVNPYQATLSLYLFFLTRDWSWLWISLTGWFLTGAATAEAQQAVLASRLRGIRASQIMTPDPVTVPGSMTVSEFIDDYMFRARHQSFPVTRDGTDTVCGLVTLDRIKHVPAGQRDGTRLADIACPLADVTTAAPEDSVANLLPRLVNHAGLNMLALLPIAWLPRALDNVTVITDD